MKKHERTACMHLHRLGDSTRVTTTSATSTSLMMPLIAVAFLGCAVSPQRDASSPSASRSLADIRAKGGESRMRMALVALPDRIYEVPVAAMTRTAVASSAVAAADTAIRATPSTAAPSSRVNVAVVGIPRLPAEMLTPVALSAPTDSQPQEGLQAQPAMVAVVERPKSPLPAPVVAASPEARAVVQPAALVQAVTPKLKLDTDYESVKHAVKFAFDQSALGRQAQAFLAKILPDAKIATHIKLTGFSDGVGTRAANERVANARAQSIREELIKNDVEPSKISVEPAMVAAVPRTRQPAWYYAQYRRVDVDITKPKQSLVVSMNHPAIRPK